MTGKPKSVDMTGPVRVIFTKYKHYILSADQPGVPIEEYFPDVKNWPAAMKGANVYETSDGPVITHSMSTNTTDPQPKPAAKPAHRREPLLIPVAGGRKKPQQPSSEPPVSRRARQRGADKLSGDRRRRLPGPKPK